MRAATSMLRSWATGIGAWIQVRWMVSLRTLPVTSFAKSRSWAARARAYRPVIGHLMARSWGGAGMARRPGRAITIPSATSCWMARPAVFMLTSKRSARVALPGGASPSWAPASTSAFSVSAIKTYSGFLGMASTVPDLVAPIHLVDNHLVDRYSVAQWEREPGHVAEPWKPLTSTLATAQRPKSGLRRPPRGGGGGGGGGSARG